MSQSFPSKYGYFNQDGTEYVITRTDTPKPWINVISNGDYGLVVSQNGGGFSWRTHSNFNRITRWNQDMVQDNWGKFIYLRDRNSGEIWSAAFQPVRNPLAIYQCRHGVGYSVLTSEYRHLMSEWTIFAAKDDPLEIWILDIQNKGAVERQLSIFTYFEWCLGFAPDNHREFHKAFLETKFDVENNILFANKRLWEVNDAKGRHWNQDWPFTAFFSTNEKILDFDGDKEAFLGNYQSLSEPAAVVKGYCSRSQGKWGDGIASLRLNIDLNTGEARRIVFVLGAVESKEAAVELARKYHQPQSAQTELDQVRKAWQIRFDPCQVETPDKAFDLMTNTWLKYQTISCRLWGRAAYYQQSGAFGFRDQLQDSLIFLPLDPAQTKKQIQLHAKHQFKDGSVLHWWHPMTETGLHSNVSDNLLWLPFVTGEYLKETGDFALLQESLPFYDDATPVPLWDHCIAALRRALERKSPRGLPLIANHDWNDGLNAVGTEMRGESIWMGHFLVKILREFADIARRTIGLSEAKYFQDQAAQLSNAINQFGWDGEWYWRASKDNGELIGSHTCEEGKIYLNAQTWSVIAKTASPQRAEQAMHAVERYLHRDYGPLLFWPAYTKPDPNIGYLSRYAPGRRENGGLYTHAGTWAVLAEAMLGKGDVAYQMYRNFCPIYRGLDPDLYQAEPYVTPGNVEGPDSPLFGRGGWTWYTGSAAWLFKVSIEGILGIRASHDGLIVHPALPSEWPGFRTKRIFRGALYDITVEQGEGAPVEPELFIDGERNDPTFRDGVLVLPIFTKDTHHQIKIKFK